MKQVASPACVRYAFLLVEKEVNPRYSEKVIQVSYGGSNSWVETLTDEQFDRLRKGIEDLLIETGLKCDEPGTAD